MVYTIDAHPKHPDRCPYKGTVWEANYSKYRQPKNYQDRLSNAGDTRVLDKRVHVVVDDLAPHNTTMGGNNPLWCGWGPAPNAAWLLRPDGKVNLAQLWFHSAQMDKAMARMLGMPEPSDDEVVAEPEVVKKAKEEWTNHFGPDAMWT